MLRGKGYFIWQIENCASDAATLVSRAVDAGLGHVIIKIADGSNIYPMNDPDGSREKLTAESIKGLRNAGIEVWGWQFVYGANPGPEDKAKRLVQRMHALGLEGVCISTQHLANNRWTAENAQVYMDTLVNMLARAGIGNPQLALSSYRIPSQQPDFPFDDFMLFCQVAMPECYWIAKNGGDPIATLQAAYDDWFQQFPTKSIVPLGAAYGDNVTIGGETFYWKARTDQITMFLNQANAMNVEAVSFWSWQHAWQQGLWDAVSAYPFKSDLQPISIAQQPPGGAGTGTAATQPDVPTGSVTAAVGLPDTTDDDGIATIEVGAPGYQEGVYANTGAELSAFVRGGYLCSWVRAEQTKSTAYAQWLPRITKDGEYAIEAWIPGINATARSAKYHITGVVGQAATVVVQLNQLNAADEWVRLGLFELDGENQFSGMVTMNNLIGVESDPDTKVAYGPLRWTRIERGKVPAGYCDGFDSPVGTDSERRQGNNEWGPTINHWNGDWVDANPYLNYYFLGYHTGVDLNLPGDRDKGSPCYSIADGEVTFSGPAYNRDGSQSGFGNLVVIRHDPYLSPEGQTIVVHSRYAHVKDILVQKGQRVRRGDQLATVWNIGTQAHHLHFDMSTTGILQDRPTNWPGSVKA
ncbi:MAG TPA: peptidoglycan DD-metalloendopeptidase family protein, partial [Aggregatilineales bacterium]|nr:peptidoglycan DD-metalloendopeptidase family protein [Aggregatilineales bacterium]